MANIPQYVSKERVSTEAPAVIQRSEKLAGTVDPGQFENKVAEQASKDLIELGEKMVKVENANDKSKAEIQHTQGMLAFEEEVKKDPSKFKDYDAYMTKLEDGVSKNFRNQFAKEEYKQDLGLKNVIFKNKLQGYVYKQEVDAGRANTLTQMDLQSSSYINAQNDEEKLSARQQIENTMAEAVKNKLFTHEQGIDEVNKTIKSADDAVKDRQQLQRRKEKELAWAQKEAVNAREQEFIQMKVNGKDKLGMPISREELIKAARFDMNAGVIEPKFAELYINALKSPKSVGAKTIDLDFANIISDINKGIKSPERIRKKMLENLSDGYLSEQDFAGASTYYDMLMDKNPDDLATMNVRKSWTGVEVFSENTTAKEESRARMSRFFISKLQSGIDPQTASVEAMREEVLYLHPEVIGKPDGAEYMDDSGRMKKILPNGDVVEVQSTTKDTRKKEKK